MKMDEMYKSYQTVNQCLIDKKYCPGFQNTFSSVTYGRFWGLICNIFQFKFQKIEVLRKSRTFDSNDQLSIFRSLTRSVSLTQMSNRIIIRLLGNTEIGIS